MTEDFKVDFEEIAQREYLISGSNEKVKIILGKPQDSPKSPQSKTDYMKYCCPYKIEGMGLNEIRYAHGADTLNVLQTAIKTIAIILNLFAKKKSISLEQKGGRAGLDLPDIQDMVDKYGPESEFGKSWLNRDLE